MRNIMISLAAVLSSMVAFGFDADTLGYYAFKDGAVGTSAIGVPIANGVSGATMASGVVSTTNVAPHVVFSDERPGKYIYASSAANAELLTEDVQSIRLGSTDFLTAGLITFPKAGAELSQHHDTGFTWEFFFKLNSDEYKGWSGGTFRMPAGGYTLGLYLPTSASDYYYGGACGDRMPKLAITDNKWHHLAVVEYRDNTENKSYISIFCDGVATDGKRTITQPISSSTIGDILVGNHNFRGTITGMRFTKRSLEKDEFLRASDFRNPDSALIAFYSFADGSAGQNVGSTEIKNAIDVGRYDDTAFRADKHSGTLALSTKEGANPSATFSSDTPGKYVFAKDVLIYENPQSIHMTSDLTGASASITFTRLGEALSKTHATGNTIEYFFKLDDAKCSGWSSSLGVDAGYRYANGTEDKKFQAYFPFYTTNEKGLRNLRYCIGSYDSSSSGYVDAYVPSVTTDGRWHHLAFVETNVTVTVNEESQTETRIYAYYDYQSCGYTKVATTLQLGGARQVVLGNNCHHGAYSCVRVTGRPLGPEEFLKVRDVRETTSVPDMIAFYPFTDKAAGTSAAGATLASVVSGSSVQYAGLVSLSSDETANPQAYFDASAPAPAVYCGLREDCRLVCTNPASIRVTSDATGKAATLTFLGLGAAVSTCQAEGHTVEYFIQYLDESYAEYVESFAVDGGYQYKGAMKPYHLYFPFYKADGKTPVCMSLGYYDGTSKQEVSLSTTPFDGKWHHIAMVYKDNAITTYLDRKPIGSIATDGIAEIAPTIDVKSYTYSTDVNVKLGARQREHARYSCLKVTNRALGPKEFLRTKPYEGFVMIIR